VVRNTIEILKQAELFRDLDEEILHLLASHASERRLGRDEILFIAGAPAVGFYVIAEGALRAYRSGADGREQVMHVERAVTTLAEVAVFDGGNYPSTVAAEEPARVFLIRKDDIISACIRHPALALAAAKLMATRLRRCAELVESLSLREVGQRVASLFLAEAASRGVETEQGIQFVLPLTHSQLAARIGTVREVVTRTISRLQSQGLILIDGKTVTVPDLKALASYANT
jgi:CRP/FNR family transcriptional regulator